MNQEQIDFVKNLYYTPEEGGSLSSFSSLLRAIRDKGRDDIRPRDLKKFLLSQELYTSHLAAKTSSPHPAIVTPHPNYGLSVDSGLMPFKDSNPKPYVILGTDQFSLRVAGRAVSSLSAVETNRALQEIIRELGGNFTLLRTDRGTEYVNKLTKDTFRRLGIRHVLAYPPNKSSVSENSLKLLKIRLFKTLQHRGTQEWGDFLQPVIQGMNNTKKPALANYSPAEIAQDPDAVSKIWYNRIERDLRRKKPQFRPFKLKIGQTVRIRYSRGLNPFRKSYAETMGSKVFTVHDRARPGQVHLYKIKDDRGNLIDGRFRSDELQPVEINDDTVWRLDGPPIKERTRNGQREFFVKFLDHDSSYNSWVRAEDIEELQDNIPPNPRPPVRRRRRRRRRAR